MFMLTRDRLSIDFDKSILGKNSYFVNAYPFGEHMQCAIKGYFAPDARFRPHEVSAPCLLAMEVSQQHFYCKTLWQVRL